MTAEEVAAQIAIRHLIASYSQAGDADDPRGFSEAFAPDGVLATSRSSHVGREAIHAFKAGNASFKSGLAPTPVFRRHHMTTIRITLDGPDAASGLVYWMVLTEIGHDHSGFYTDRYVRLNGEWFIAHRLVTLTWRAEHSCIAPDHVSPEFVRQA